MCYIDGELVIGILARDCKKALVSNMQNVELLGSLFKKYHVVVYENDSVDGTKDILRNWAARNANVSIIMEDTDTATIPNKSNQNPFPEKSIYRIGKMVRFRYRLMNVIRERFLPDYVCFIDIDIEKFYPQTVVEAIKNAPSDWGALFANGAVYMKYSNHVQPHFMQYDSYAYIDEGVDPLKSKNWVVDKDFHLITSARMTWKMRSHQYLSCNSAFNGMGIYRWDLIKEQNYDVLQNQELEEINVSLCEHVGFNMELIRKGYKNYIARDMKVVYYYEYPKEKKGLGRWQNYYRAFYYYQGRPRLAVRTIWHYMKERCGLFPYQRL